MKTINEIIEPLNIQFTVQKTISNPLMDAKDSRDMINWMYVMSKDGKQFSSFFSTGRGWVEPIKNPKFFVMADRPTPKDLERIKSRTVVYNKDEDRFEFISGGSSVWENEVLQSAFQLKRPEIEDIIECIIMDASVLEYDTFEEWARNWGYDSDSRSAEKSFHNTRHYVKEFRQFVGKEVFDQLREVEV